MLIANAPNEKVDDPYCRPRLTEAWRKIEREITDAGIANTHIVELPLDETTILFSPETPDTAHAIGAPIEIGKDGEYIFHPQEKVGREISL